MDKIPARKIVGLVVIVFLVLNVLLFATKVYGSAVFWTVIILGAIVAYLLPRVHSQLK